MAKTTKRKTIQTKNSSTKSGIKGGEALIPSTIGAMAGAAIGGLAGLALGSETARKRLALAKDKAIQMTGELLENVNAETEDIQGEVGKIAEGALKRKTNKSRKTK